MVSGDIAQQILQSKLASLQNAPSNVRSNLASYQPADAHPFQVNSSPFASYLAPGVGTVALLKFKAPQGMVAVINQMVIGAIGGGVSDGSGNVVWRCWLTGTGIDGLENIAAPSGDFSSPATVQ